MLARRTGRAFKFQNDSLFLFCLAVIAHLLVDGDEAGVCLQGIRSETYCLPESPFSIGQPQIEKIGHSKLFISSAQLCLVLFVRAGVARNPEFNFVLVRRGGLCIMAKFEVAPAQFMISIHVIGFQVGHQHVGFYGFAVAR